MTVAPLVQPRSPIRPNQGVTRYLSSEESKTVSLGELAMRNSGAEHLPDTTISGYHCRVLRKQTQGMTITDWIWRGIIIRERLVSTTDSYVATDDPDFSTPEGVRVKHSFASLLASGAVPAKEPGWGCHVTLGSGWHAATGIGQLQCGSQVLWLFKRR